VRYVDITECRPPDGWSDRAALAKTAVMSGADPDTHANIWRELKDQLSALLHNKCWFCETQIDRSDNAVDHFRPKKAVTGTLAPHAGYRWLAFAIENFRYSCTFCNSRRIDQPGGTAGGKANLFPLLDETKRVYAEGPVGNEFPTLLDPCRVTDWLLLGCRTENGSPCAANDGDDTRKRVEASIAAYHLDREATCMSRHQHVVELVALIDTAKAIWPQMIPNSASSHDFEKETKSIIRKIRKRAPYSGDMMFILKGHRSNDHPWIDDLVQSA
jgi:hypothetical protein